MKNRKSEQEILIENIQSKVVELVNKNKLTKARRVLLTLNAVDMANVLEEISKDKIIKVFRMLPKHIATETFAYISSELQQYVIQKITDKEILDIVDELFFDDTMDLLEEMPANIVKKILKNTDFERRKLINQFLQYPENSAGSLMTIEYVDLESNMTVEEAIQHIRNTGLDKETINTCYVIRNNRELEGIVSIRRLILSDSREQIYNIMEKNVIFANTIEDRENVARLFKKYNHTSLPVVDNENRLVGIITVDDIVDVIEVETTEDFQKMAAMTPSEKEYLKTHVVELSAKRIMWLLILLVSSTVSAYIIRGYQSILLANAFLSEYIPTIMNTGGNAGSQSSTLIIRGMAVDEIRQRDVLRVLFKEFQVGLMTGIVLGLFNFCRLYYFERLVLGAQIPLMGTLSICISICMVVTVSKITGALLPFGAMAAKLDPAIMAGPLVSTIVDAIALTIFFRASSMLIH